LYYNYNGKTLEIKLNSQQSIGELRNISEVIEHLDRVYISKTKNKNKSFFTLRNDKEINRQFRLYDFPYSISKEMYSKLLIPQKGAFAEKNYEEIEAFQNRNSDNIHEYRDIFEELSRFVDNNQERVTGTERGRDERLLSLLLGLNIQSFEISVINRETSLVRALNFMRYSKFFISGVYSFQELCEGVSIPFDINTLFDN
jgi:hypothetical protein